MCVQLMRHTDHGHVRQVLTLDDATVTGLQFAANHGYDINEVLLLGVAEVQTRFAMVDSQKETRHV